MEQRVLVTPGASGIGLQVALVRGAGGKVFVCDIAAKALENLKQEVPSVATKVCDVSKREDIEQMIAFGVKP
jgi:short-subunit dehydrogenase involved in D-alanine esterification of teichoic acids